MECYRLCGALLCTGGYTSPVPHFIHCRLSWNAKGGAQERIMANMNQSNQGNQNQKRDEQGQFTDKNQSSEKRSSTGSSSESRSDKR